MKKLATAIKDTVLRARRPRFRRQHILAVDFRVGDAPPRQVNNRGLALIRSFESYSPVAYVCPAGKMTIGWGHTGVDVHAGMKISLARAEDLLREDVANASRAVQRMVDVPLTENEFGALVSFVFNLGGMSLFGSTLRRRLLEGNFQAAADEFIRWSKVRNPKTGELETCEGLIRRREDERELFLLA